MYTTFSPKHDTEFQLYQEKVMQNIIAVISSFFSIKKILNLTTTIRTFLERYLKLVIPQWQKTQDLWLILHYARFSVFVLILGAAVLFLEQGKELALRIDGNLYHFLFFYIGLFFWALQNWFGSRRLLNERFGRPDKDDKSLFAISLRHAPRVMGAAPYVFATVAIFLSWQQKGLSIFSVHALIFLITFVSGVFFYYLVIIRHDWIKQKMGSDYDDLKAIENLLKPATYFYSLFFIAGGIFFPPILAFGPAPWAYYFLV
jgi:hypothetical protein